MSMARSHCLPFKYLCFYTDRIEGDGNGATRRDAVTLARAVNSVHQYAEFGVMLLLFVTKGWISGGLGGFAKVWKGFEGFGRVWKGLGLN